MARWEKNIVELQGLAHSTPVEYGVFYPKKFAKPYGCAIERLLNLVMDQSIWLKLLNFKTIPHLSTLKLKVTFTKCLENGNEIWRPHLLLCSSGVRSSISSG